MDQDPRHSLSCRGRESISLIVETLGVYVKYDEGTLLKTKMNEARICIHTKKMDKVVDFLLLKIKDASFSIRIMEYISYDIAKNQYSRHIGETES